MDFPSTRDKAAVTVRNAYKTYDKKKYVLNGLNMRVKEGTIYGLLGASGCGKSTLLNSIIGLVGLNNGTIELSITNKRELGFMPQAICLYEQFTVVELLTYYGTMCELSQTDLQNRIDVMYKILELPDKNRCLPNLSGGQKRRISLAIALLHDPKLLILDEPTVGVDPVLRQKIWDFLMEWCQGGRTIIITTHYIEETAQAHTVALMRQGVMLCEKPPKTIMEECNTQYLEDAFLILSQKQGEDRTDDIPIVSKQLKYSPLAHIKDTFNFNRFSVEVKKNLIFLWRNFATAVFILLLPSMSIGLFHGALGDDPKDLRLSVINDEIADINFCNSLPPKMNKCDIDHLSCYYLKLLEEKSYRLTNYNDVSDALDNMNRTNTWAILQFRSDFSSALIQRMEETTLNEDDIIDNSTIKVNLDRSSFIVYELVKKQMREAYKDLVKEIVKFCNYSDMLVDLPIKFKTPIYGKKDPDFREFAGSAMLMVIMFGMPLSYGVVIILEEKNSGATSRSLVSGTSMFEIFAAHAVVQTGVQLFHTLTCIIFMFGILDYPFRQPFLSSAILLLQGLAGISFCFSLAVSFESLSGVSSIATGITFITTIIGGWMWPLEGIHPSIKPLSLITPNTLPAQTLRTLTLRGWNFSNKEVYLGFLASIVWICIFLAYTVWYVRKNKNKVFVSQRVG